MHHTRMHRTRMHRTRMHHARMHPTRMHCTRMHRTQMHRQRMHHTRMHRNHDSQMMIFIVMMTPSYTDEYDQHCTQQRPMRILDPWNSCEN